MAEVIATENRMAKIFKISERSVREKYKEARVEPGRYDLLQAIEILLNNGISDPSVELKKVETEYKKLKLGIMEGRYHETDDIKLLVEDMLIRFKAKINAIPAIASSELLNVDNRRDIERILKKYLNEALKELSSYESLRMEDIELDEEENS